MKRNRLMCNTVATMVNTKTSFDSVRYFLLAHSYFTEKVFSKCYWYVVSPQLLPPQQEATAFLAIDKQAKRLESIQHLCGMQQELRSQSPFGTWWRALIRLLLYWVRLFRPTPPSTFFPCRYGVLLPQSKWLCLWLGRTLADWLGDFHTIDTNPF